MTEFGVEEEDGQQMLFPEAGPRQRHLELAEKLGYVNVDDLCGQFSRLGLVREISNRVRFLHWELEYADLFRDHGGFDLVLGNPPWVKVEWNEKGVLSDDNPLFEIKKLSASNIAEADLRNQALQNPLVRQAYFGEFESMDGTQNFLNGTQNYPLLKGTQTNLYKCFLPLSWKITSSQGVGGFLHPEGV